MSLAFVVLKDLADEYGWRIKLLHSENKYVVWGTMVFLISYTLLFGVLNGGSFIYFQF